MKTRRTFLKNVLLALPLVPAFAKVSSRAMTAPQAPKPGNGSWGKGGIDWKPLQESTSIRVEHDPKNPDLYRISYTGNGCQIDHSPDEGDEDEEDEYETWWGDY